MKTLTAKLAVAALLVAGAHVKADQFTQLITGVEASYNVYTECQNAVNTWYAASAQNKNVSGIKARMTKGMTSAANYLKPAVVIAASVTLAAAANNDVCKCPKLNTLAPSAVGLLTALTVVNYGWNNRDAQTQAADSAAEATAAANAQAAYQSATAASTDSKAKLAATVSKK